MVHVWSDHVEYGALPAFRLGPFDCHLVEFEDVVVRQHLQQLDFSQRSDGEAVFFIVHQNLLHCEDAAGDAMARLVDFAKSSLAEFLHHLIFANLGATLEAALHALLRGRVR